MINILIAAFGVVLVIGGFYAMSYGFATPPSISLFFIGLILTVLGALMVIIFGSNIDINQFKVKSKEKKASKPKKDKSVVKPKKIEPTPVSKEIKPTPIGKKPLSEDKLQKNRPKFAMGKNIEPARSKEDEDQYVKKRLDKLKENYIKNAKDIENLIEERLDSFKGTIDQIKSESKDPSIIWSFNAGDVKETMQDTILKANTKILMMYPWVRNIDVSVLKRFMETDSKMIIQEASLDDDTSVELLKLLVENNVKIRTMPHVHTVAIVSDEDNGLIISTDPIYESFEVGVIYKDQKSIEEIERMFNEAWELSQDIDLNIN